MTTIKFVGGQSAGNGQFRPSNGDRVEFLNSSTGGTATIINDMNGRTDFYDQSTAGYATIESLYGSTTFHNNSSAGRATIYTIYLPTIFRDNSSAALANFVLPGDTAPVLFYDNSSAGRATFTGPASVFFSGHSTAAESIITIASDNLMLEGSVSFSEMSTAGKSSIKISGNTYLFFSGQSTAGSAKIENNKQSASSSEDDGFIGTVDFSSTSGPQNNHRISAGSIAGSGTYYLGSNRLTVGSLNTNTAVSGAIRDGNFRGSGGTGGSLEKVGSGTFTLSGANTYSGGTTVSAGRLELVSAQAAGTGAITFGSGAQVVQLDAAALGAPGGTFGNVLSGFDYGDTLDLRGLAYRVGASAVLSWNTLTVASGSTTESFTLGGNYAGRQFQVYNDGAAGSAIRVLPGSSPAHTSANLSDAGSLIAGAANVGQGASGNTAITLHDGTQDAVLLQQGDVGHITGFRLNEDVLDLSRVLSESRLAESHLAVSLIEGGSDSIGNYATLTHSGSDATLFFNAAGTASGPGHELAVLHGAGTGSTLQSLIAGHDLRL